MTLWLTNEIYRIHVLVSWPAPGHRVRMYSEPASNTCEHHQRKTVLFGPPTPQAPPRGDEPGNIKK